MYRSSKVSSTAIVLISAFSALYCSTASANSLLIGFGGYGGTYGYGWGGDAIHGGNGGRGDMYGGGGGGGASIGYFAEVGGVGGEGGGAGGGAGGLGGGYNGSVQQGLHGNVGADSEKSDAFFAGGIASIDRKSTYDTVVIGGGGGGGGGGGNGYKDGSTFSPDRAVWKSLGQNGGDGVSGLLTVSDSLTSTFVQVGGFGGGGGAGGTFGYTLGGGPDATAGGNGGKGGDGRLIIGKNGSLVFDKLMRGGNLVIGGTSGANGSENSAGTKYFASAAGVGGNGGHGTVQLQDGGIISGNVAQIQINKNGELIIGDQSNPSTTGGTLDINSIVNNGSISFYQSNNDQMVNSSISGTGSLSQRGKGTTILTVTNFFTGDISITKGKLSISKDANLGDAKNKVRIDGGTLRVTSSFATNREINSGINGAGFEITDDNTFTQNGLLSGSGDLIKNGSGTLVLGIQNNTYLGNTVINDGIISFSTQTSLGSNNSAVILSGGTLQATASLSNSHSIVVSDGKIGNLDVANDAVLTQNGLVSGGGDLKKTGGGTLVLNQALAVEGGVIIADGKLQANAGNILKSSLYLELGDNATFDLGGYDQLVNNLSGAGHVAIGENKLTLFNTRDNIYSGNFSGSGEIEQKSLGTFILTGDNSGFNGKTTISAGTLQIGDGGTSGNLAGSILDDSKLVFNRSDDFTTNSVISGNGQIEQKGSGTLTLLGDSSEFNGQTEISAGTLQIGNGGTSGNLAGSILDDSKLVFNRSDDFTTNSVISGNGQIEQKGSGTLTLLGDSSGFSGVTNIERGSNLIVGTAGGKGKLGGDVNVFDRGWLGGYGTIGSDKSSNIHFYSGSTLAIGNEIGTINMNGNLQFDQGSTYEVKVDPAGSDSDLVAVNGKAIINGGSVVHIGKNGLYKPTATYLILSTTDGLSGKFDGATSNFKFLNVKLKYDENNVYMGFIRNDIAICGSGSTYNENQVACAIAPVDGNVDDPLYNAILNLNDDEVDYAFDQLSGEIYATAQGILIEDSRFQRDAVLMRIRSAFDGVGAQKSKVVSVDTNGNQLVDATTDGLAVWGNVFGSWNVIDGDGNAAKAQRSIGGMVAGFDGMLVDNLRVGFMGGYTTTNVDLDSRHSTMDMKSYFIGTYLGGQWGAWRLTGGINNSWINLASQRSVAFRNFSDALTSDYSANLAQFYGESAVQFEYLDTKFEPYAQIAFVKLDTDGFSETGGRAALKADSRSLNRFYSTIGLRSARAIDIFGIESEASLGAGWRHAFDNLSPDSNMAFAADNEQRFNVKGIPSAADAALVEVGLDVKLNRKSAVSLTYQGVIAENVEDHGFKLNLNTKW